MTGTLHNDVGRAQRRNFVGGAIAVLLLYALFWLPGFFANRALLREALPMEKLAGRRLPGVRALQALFWLRWAMLAAGLVTATLVLIAFLNDPAAAG